MKLTDEEVRKIRVALNSKKNFYLHQSLEASTIALQYATLEEKFSGGDVEIAGE